MISRRRLRAYFIYLRKPLVDFLPLFLVTLGLVLLGGLLMQHYYVEERLTYSQAVYATFALLLGEPQYAFPSHWALEALYFILPIMGLVVVLDGIVRFSYYIFRRDESSPDWVRAMSQTLNRHVILFGLGKVGFRVLQQLLKLGEQVVVLEKNPLSPNLAFARNHGVPCHIGTGREEGILDAMNVARAKSLICATDDDLANLELAIDARKAQPDIRVVLRMFDQELAQKVRESFGIHVAFSTAELAAPAFATASADPSIINAFYVGRKLLVVADIVVRAGSALVGMTVRDLRVKHACLVIAIGRGGEDRLIPGSDDALEAGHELTLQCEPAHLRQIQELNGEPRRETSIRLPARA
jgi:Trk K+ transport system NAD-binding subunit